MAEPGRIRLREFVNPEQLAAALADAVAGALQARLARDKAAALAVSGGTTPVKFFQALSSRQLDWPLVTVTLVDDRCVPESSERSNARLVEMHLLQNAAAQATFLPLIGAAESAIAALPLPFAAVVLGMGLDGHTASFFPGGDHLAAALAGYHLLETMNAPGANEPRVTLTLAPLLGADFLALHIEGAAKRKALEAAMQPGSAEAMPVRAVLARQPGPEIFWCP
jgi:6-phosphogluconolactonase